MLFIEDYPTYAAAKSQFDILIAENRYEEVDLCHESHRQKDDPTHKAGMPWRVKAK